MALIETLSVPCGLIFPTANSTSASITEPTPTVTKPSGDGVIMLGDSDKTGVGQMTASGLKLVFFGVGSDSNTFSANVYGWEVLPGGGSGGSVGNYDLWVPVLLATFTSITLDSAQPGVAGATEAATALFCTAITLGVGNSGISVEVVSPGHAAGKIAHVVLDTKGARLAEVRVAKGTATSVNGLWRKM